MPSKRSSTMARRPTARVAAGTNATGSSGGGVVLKSTGSRTPLKAQSPAAQRGIRRVEKTAQTFEAASSKVYDAAIDKDSKRSLREKIYGGLRAAADNPELFSKRLAGAIAKAEGNAKAAIEDVLEELGITHTYGARNLSELEDSLVTRGILPSGAGMMEDILKGGIHAGGVYVPTWALLVAFGLVRGSQYNFVDNALSGTSSLSLSDALMKRGNPFLKSEVRAARGDGKTKIKQNLIFETHLTVRDLLFVVDGTGKNVLVSKSECSCPHAGAVYPRIATAAEKVVFPTANLDVGTLYRLGKDECQRNMSVIDEIEPNSDKDMVLPKPASDPAAINALSVDIKAELPTDYALLDFTKVGEIGQNGAVAVLVRVRAIVDCTYFYQVQGRVVASPDIRTIAETFVPLAVGAWNKGAGFISALAAPLVSQYAGFRTSPLFTGTDAELESKAKAVFGLDNPA